jgi:hypothetical protein
MTTALHGGEVSFTARPLYPLRPSDRRLGGPQSRSERCGVEKIFFLCRKSNTGRLTLAIPTELSRQEWCSSASGASYLFMEWRLIKHGENFYSIMQ